MKKRTEIAFALLWVGLTSAARATDVPFEPPVDVSQSALAARSVAAGDLDGDGDLDAVSASAADNKIAWYDNASGNGSTWTAHTLGTTALTAGSVATADVDADGDLDVLATSWSDDTVAWYENLDGAGTFGAEQPISTSADGAIAVAAADVDGDGDVDVLVANSVANSVLWYENANGDGSSWVTRTVSSSVNTASAVHPADLDGDGDIDVLSAAFGSNAVHWHENTGGGTFAIQALVSGTASGALGVFAADLDGDGDLDALSASSGNDRIAWYENVNGDGSSWGLRTVSTAADFARSIFAADLDLDGDVDVLSASSNDDEVAWYENLDGIGTSWFPRTITGGADQAYAVVAADVDRDGDADVLSASSSDNTIAWYENETIHRGAVFASSAPIGTTEPTPHSAAIADLDRDGDADVAVPSINLDRLSWYENAAGDGSTWTRHTLASQSDGAGSVAAADMDGDGDLDLLCASAFDDEVSWYPNRLDEGTNDFGPQKIVTTTANETWSVFAADVDRDGDVDALATAAFDDKVAWYENGGDGTTWTPHTITQDPDGPGGVEGFANKPFSVFATDLDGDGDVDVLSASQDDDKIAWYENANGSGTTWTARTISTAADLAWSVFAADLDGDGDADVLSGSSLDHEIAWYENRLNEASNDFGSQQVISSTLDGARSVRAADLDLDGDPDVVAAGSFGFDVEVAWFENRLNEAFADFGPQQTIATPAGSPTVAAGDVDGDGDPDVVWTGYFQPNTHQISWNLNRGGQFALTTDDVAPASLLDGETASLLRITVTHRGRAGDTDLEPASLDLLLEESPGMPLTGAEADAIIETLFVFHDDGSGQLELGTDVQVASVASFPLVAGELTVTLADGDPELQVSHGSPETYFAAVELEAGASTQSPNSFRMTHRTETSSTAEDRDHDIPLSLEYTPDVPSRSVSAIASVAGAAPDGASVPGQPLTLRKRGGGTSITLDWGTSCLATDSDFAVYEGLLGSFTSHSIKVCSTGGAQSHTFLTPSANVYYVVVPRNATREGSYGRGPGGAPRQQAASACLVQAVGACP